jgi:hypothetical protein
MIMRRSTKLKRVRRTVAFDKDQRFVTPRRGPHQMDTHFIPSSELHYIDEQFRDGDIVLFMKDASALEGEPGQVMIRHLAILKRNEGRVLLIHSTRNFGWRPDANANTPASHTGVYYDQDRRCEQLGVEFCGTFAGSHLTIKTPCDSYFAMNQTRKRSLAEYATSNFDGIKILRLLNQTEFSVT